MDKQGSFIPLVKETVGLTVLFLLLEGIFRSLAGMEFEAVRLIHIGLLSLSTAAFLVFLTMPFKRKVARIFQEIILGLFGFLGLTQITYSHYLNAYYSLRLFVALADRVTEGYTGDFIKFIPLGTVILFVPALLVGFLNRITSPRFSLKRWFLFWCLSLLCHFGALTSLTWGNDPQTSVTPRELYAYPYLTESSLDQLGLVTTVVRDALSLTKPEPESELVILPEPVVKPDETPTDLTRIIDDASWRALAANETDAQLKSIDDYLLSRRIPDRNAMSGRFKDKNLILIMVEAFDLMALNPTLTPTLYRMSQEGFYFSRFFTPQYSCATGESEFIALTSLIPRSGICSPNTYQNNRYDESLFALFNKAGYYSSSYHNYSDRFYERTILHANMGSAKFYNNDDLSIKTLKGWPSDVNLMEEALPHFLEQPKYFSFIITSSTHMPYDIDSTLGNRYLKEVQAVYPEAPLNIQRYKSKAIELDKALETLLDRLGDAGQLEDTVIVLFADHFPLKTSREDILNNTDQDVNRAYGFNINLSPMIIYHATETPRLDSTVCSTFDLLPTLANLFDLDYDPRLYFGNDIFDPEADPLVPFSSMAWVSDEGYYSVSKGKFVPDPGFESFSPETVKAINAKLKNDAEISARILKSDYFAHR